MKQTIITFTCALISPFAFAQTSPSSTDAAAAKSSPPTKTETAAATTSGTVVAFTPEEMIAVKTSTGDSVSFVIGKVTYVNKAGKDIEAATIKPGAKVQVTGNKNGDQMVANRIALDE
jgi:hypothetical protein